MKALSFFLAAITGLLVIAPAFNYELPVMVNSFLWTYLVAVSGFLGVLLLRQRLPSTLKALAIHLFALCFFSQVPYHSFNAYLLLILCFWLFLAFQKADYKLVLTAIEAAFWLEVLLTVFQLLGRDQLLNFNRPEKIFLGTVMQYMRFASVLAILSPLLLVKSKWYAIPLLILCGVSRSSGFALSLFSGLGIYAWLMWPRRRKVILLSLGLALAAYMVYDFGSWGGAVNPKHGGRLISWAWVLKTWVFDTSGAVAGSIGSMHGPFRLDWFLLGHGTDTFLELFPIYKHDMNPFPNAHNDWLQLFWETGLIGGGLFIAYVVSLVGRCAKRPDLLAGLTIIGVNMFFAFPSRMTQTVLLMIAYVAYCETQSKKEIRYGNERRNAVKDEGRHDEGTATDDGADGR